MPGPEATNTNHPSCSFPPKCPALEATTAGGLIVAAVRVERLVGGYHRTAPRPLYHGNRSRGKATRVVLSVDY